MPIINCTSMRLPIKMGHEIEVAVRLANQFSQKAPISEDEQFLIAAYSAATPEDKKEDAV